MKNPKSKITKKTKKSNLHLNLEKRGFMVMPFNDSLAENIYRYYTKPVCKKINLALRRSDELFTNNPIIEDIIKEIKQD